MLSGLGLKDVRVTAETAHYNGGSAWAVYWRQTVAELRTRLVASGKLDDRLIDTFLARCADPAWWTQTIAFTAAAGHVRGELARLFHVSAWPSQQGLSASPTEAGAPSRVRVYAVRLPLVDGVGQVGHPLRRLRADRLQGHAARVHALEQADSGAEQHG